MKALSRWTQVVLAGTFAVATLVAGTAAQATTPSPYAPVAADIPPVPASATRLPNGGAGNPILTVDIALPARYPAAAALYARRVSTPGDPLRGHYLSPGQYADDFGPGFNNYVAVVNWAKSAGLTVRQLSYGRSVISVTGHTSTIEQAFHVGFNYYQTTDGTMLRTATTQPSIPTAIAAKVAGVVGLSMSKQYAEQVIRRPYRLAPSKISSAGGGVGGGFTPADLRTAYKIPSPAVVGPKEVVAVYEQGGFFPSDIATFTKANKLPNVPIAVRSVDGYGGGVDDPGVELETALDLETLIGINPGLSKIIVYENGDSFNTSLLDSLTAMANDRAASIISISYGLDENLQGTTALAAENAVLTQMAAQGQEVLVSAGDGGVYGDDPYGYYGGIINVEDPGSQPFVTSVGGTTLYAGPKGVYQAEIAWNDFGIGAGATGGGVSSYFPLPAYQKGQFTSHSAFYANGGSDTFRNEPDIAAVASPFTGESVYSAINGGWLVVGGTSLASPIIAAELSLYDQISELVGVGHLGFFNPTLYAMANPFIAYNDGLLHDITDGTNGNANENGLGGFTAGTDADNVSGVGSIDNASFLFNGLIDGAVTETNPPAEVTNVVGTVSGTSATISWTASPTATGYIVYVQNPYTNELITEVPTSGTSVTVTGLASTNTYYDFQIESLNPTGEVFAPILYLQFGSGAAMPRFRARQLR